MKRIILVLSLAWPAMASEWTLAEIALESAFQTVLFVDWKQTSEMHRSLIVRPDGSTYHISERNAFLGNDPKQSKINLFCIGTALLHFVVSNSMDHKSRIGWQSVTMTVEGLVVGNNFKVGARVKW